LSVVQLFTFHNLAFMNDIKKHIAFTLKKIRKEKGLSQEKLALSADIDRTYIQSIERGNRNVSIEILDKLSIALNIHISEFFKNY